MDADEKWIASLDGVLTETDMRAAIARGYERGKAEGAADRDRLAKRCEELREGGEMYLDQCARLEQQLGRTYAALPDDRLAALESRLTALVEALVGCFGAGGLGSYRDLAARLAALRSPGEGPCSITAPHDCDQASHAPSGWQPTPQQQEYIARTIREGYGLPDPDPRVQHWIEQCRAVTDALATAGLAAVSVDDLEWLLSEAETCEMRMPTSNPRLREKREEIMDRIRAAVARKEG